MAVCNSSVTRIPTELLLCLKARLALFLADALALAFARFAAGITLSSTWSEINVTCLAAVFLSGRGIIGGGKVEETRTVDGPRFIVSEPP